jgi:sugar/nucleoside kinase (ribokinase family)
VIKKGEHGALLVWEDGVFFAPAYPLEDVVDPTGAGDAFAGGLMGYLAENGDYSFAGLKKAMIHGSVVASFTVEEFGPGRLARVTEEDINIRYNRFLDMTSFEAAATPEATTGGVLPR